MNDFAQTGLICTLQRLNETHLGQIEAELEALAGEKPVSLILPCHAAELGRHALDQIHRELKDATWLHEVVVSMNGLDQEGFAQAVGFFQGLPQVRILWNDGPLLAPTIAGILGCAPDAIPHGKGLNVWAAAGLICKEATTEIIVTQDCDVASFRRESLARLCYACIHPKLRFACAKMYYSRVTDRLYGRVSRLFLAPLLQAFVRTAGHRPLLDFLLSFRYPLAGECGLRRDLLAALPINSGWGLEIGILCDLFRKIDPREVCQVDGGSGYDHKHQNVAGALEIMCAQIAETLLFQLRAEGLEIGGPFLEALSVAYQKESELSLHRSAALALINGIPFDGESEGNIVKTFSAILSGSSNESRAAVLPPWSRILSDRPAAAEQFFCAAAAC